MGIIFKPGNEEKRSVAIQYFDRQKINVTKKNMIESIMNIFDRFMRKSTD